MVKGKTGPKTKPVEERFWPKVKIGLQNECWLWQARLDKKGYGHFCFSCVHQKYKFMAASRAAYILTNGSIPDDVLVRYTCDNPPCCNPAHLIAGSQQDNVQDMIDRKRKPIGSACSRARLNEDQVKEIRSLNASGWTYTQLRKRFDVGESTIWNILAGNSWKHVV
jgi:hypothetical protein